MKTEGLHTTNYYDTFIEVAEDCPVKTAEIPPVRENSPTVAGIQFEMIYDRPYFYTSDDVIFETFARKNEIPASQRMAARSSFFSKGQPCFRASPLTKRYGWGLHSDTNGKIAIYPMESKEYVTFTREKSLRHLKAMRSKKA